jgi:hypothetical protein
MWYTASDITSSAHLFFSTSTIKPQPLESISFYPERRTSLFPASASFSPNLVPAVKPQLLGSVGPSFSLPKLLQPISWGVWRRIIFCVYEQPARQGKFTLESCKGFAFADSVSPRIHFARIYSKLRGRASFLLSFARHSFQALRTSLG